MKRAAINENEREWPSWRKRGITFVCVCVCVCVCVFSSPSVGVCVGLSAGFFPPFVPEESQLTRYRIIVSTVASSTRGWMHPLVDVRRICANYSTSGWHIHTREIFLWEFSFYLVDLRDTAKIENHAFLFISWERSRLIDCPPNDATTINNNGYSI